jgi:hypothetical protein
MKVSLPYDPTWKALYWAKKNCPSYITNYASYGNDSCGNDRTVIHYCFGNERDVVAFTMKWM